MKEATGEIGTNEGMIMIEGDQIIIEKIGLLMNSKTDMTTKQQNPFIEIKTY